MNGQNPEVNNKGAPEGMVLTEDGRIIVDPELYKNTLKGTCSSIFAVVDGPKGWLGTEFSYRKSSPN